MATRLYLGRELRPPGQTVTPDAGWEKTAGALLARLEQRKSTLFASSTTSIAANGTNGNDTLLGQWISSPLDSNQTISGTVKGQMRMAESAAGLDARVQVIIRVIQSDLSTVRGTLLAMSAAALSNEFNTSLRNIKLPLNGSAALTNVNALTGDRIVVEIGARQHATASGNVQMDSKDNAGTDLAEDETTTTANDPWIEFSGAITFSKPDMVASQVDLAALYLPDSASTKVRASQVDLGVLYKPDSAATKIRATQVAIAVLYKVGSIRAIGSAAGSSTATATLRKGMKRSYGYIF